MTREEVVARLEAAGFASGPDGPAAPTPPFSQDAAFRAAPPRRSDFDLLPDGRPAFANGRALKPAGVLVALVARAEGPTILLTQRTHHLKHHAGQIAFPGGRREPGDADILETALRETEEEVGLDRRLVEVLGQLEVYETTSAYAVTPVIGWVEPPFDLTVDPFEVEEAFEVPLAFVLDPANHKRETMFRDGLQRHYYVLPYGDYRIWGATAGMLVNLHDTLMGPPC